MRDDDRIIVSSGDLPFVLWYDHGPGTHARLVKNAYVNDVAQEFQLGWGSDPHTFVQRYEAVHAARVLAGKFPDIRFAVKDRAW